eukprot:CAMPEP_0174301678 /NCGR_PEP_ID=MMETSP0809-20121228/59175_1 /TAXON_ID=73025 ORGANISM="Eutreptiella gymnastica-like, Strain CCMP1594" /NCGR_SAMPLE_ID=MMETSP0809 /ASSEMBLY_ACC=CAM_ASM_000658 /LENGTH=127 /DNA_ID=CAMNT_0015407463 /DNA_START=270 /DNA_END=653 /DNA_ORIENTATION=-
MRVKNYPESFSCLCEVSQMRDQGLHTKSYAFREEILDARWPFIHEWFCLIIAPFMWMRSMDYRYHSTNTHTCISSFEHIDAKVWLHALVQQGFGITDGHTSNTGVQALNANYAVSPHIFLRIMRDNK